MDMYEINVRRKRRKRAYSDINVRSWDDKVVRDKSIVSISRVRHQLGKRWDQLRGGEQHLLAHAIDRKR